MTLESQKIEWKQSWQDEYLKWICGFANAQGKTWDRLVEEKATLQDIDKSWVEFFKKAGLPDPIIEERNSGITVELLKTPGSDPDDSERCRNDFGMMSERCRNDFGSEIAKTFEIICQQPECTTEQIAEEMGKATRTIERYISKLKKAGLITRQGPKLGGYWKIQVDAK